jgi:hypothetical protein
MALPPSRSGYRGNAQQGWLFRTIPCLDLAAIAVDREVQFTVAVVRPRPCHSMLLWGTAISPTRQSLGLKVFHLSIKRF